MIVSHANSLSVYQFDSFSYQKDALHFISTRMGGSSSPPYESLNLGFHTGDNPQLVLRNRELFASSVRVPLVNFTVAKQVHDGNVKIVTRDLKGSGCDDFQSGIDATDAMVTNESNICLMVLLADCVPVVFHDVSKKVVGIAHAGWRGTVRLVAQNTLRIMQQEFNCSPDDVIVGIGPSIGPCCYQVGPEVIVEVEKTFQNRNDYIRGGTPDGRAYFDLWAANFKQLIELGIREKNIEVANICTFHNADKFFSERHQRGKTGRFGTAIMLKE